MARKVFVVREFLHLSSMESLLNEMWDDGYEVAHYGEGFVVFNDTDEVSEDRERSRRRAKREVDKFGDGI